jgi:hypothetical protein
LGHMLMYLDFWFLWYFCYLSVYGLSCEHGISMLFCPPCKEIHSFICHKTTSFNYLEMALLLFLIDSYPALSLGSV